MGDQSAAAVGMATFEAAGHDTVEATIRIEEDGIRSARRGSLIAVPGISCFGQTVGGRESAIGSAPLVAAPRSAVATGDLDTIEGSGPGGGPAVAVPLVDAHIEGIQVGFHDLALPMLEFDVERVVVTEADGSPAACIQ